MRGVACHVPLKFHGGVRLAFGKVTPKSHPEMSAITPFFQTFGGVHPKC